MLPNIGLAARAGSGKGVLAAELVKRGYEVVSFATPVKIEVARMVLGGVSADMALRYVQDYKPQLRPMLQAYGMAVRTLVEEDHWIKIALEGVWAYNGLGASVVIDDVRFANEVAALKAAGFTLIRIDRPHWHRTLYGSPTLAGQQADHISEQVEGLDVDRVLVNDTTPQTLLRKLDHYLAGLNG